MASRTMHYLVGNEVAKHVKIKNWERFIAGNLYPDCVEGPGGRSGRKAESHFVAVERDKKCWSQVARDFSEKYAAHFPQDELYLGYYCHLLTDWVWHDEVYTKLKESYQAMDFLTFSQPLYRDYHRLNEILRAEYGLQYRTVLKFECEIEEVQLELWDDYIRELEEDFREDTGATVAELEVLEYERICLFIEKAITICGKEIEELWQNGLRI